MTCPVIEGMRERGFGRIVSISSINDQKGQIGQTNYAASKAGDIGFTKSLAQESAGKGITVNVVCPGYIATNRVKAVPKEVLENIGPAPLPVGRLGEPEEIARCTLIRDARGVLYVEHWVVTGLGHGWSGGSLKAHTQICTDRCSTRNVAVFFGSSGTVSDATIGDELGDELRGFGTPPAAKKSWSYSGTRWS